MCGKMVFGCAISSLSVGYGLLFAFLQHDISKKCVPRFFVSRNFSKKTSNEFKIKKTQYKVLSF